MTEWNDACGKSWSLKDFDSREGAFLASCNDCCQLSGQAQEDFVCGVEEGLQVAVPGDAGSLMMNYDQIRSLVQNGHIVGSHTLTHPNMAHITEDEAKVDDKRRVTQAGDNPLSLKLIRTDEDG